MFISVFIPDIFVIIVVCCTLCILLYKTLFTHFRTLCVCVMCRIVLIRLAAQKKKKKIRTIEKYILIPWTNRTPIIPISPSLPLFSGSFHSTQISS